MLDTFDRRVMGWSIDSSQTSTLVTSALGMAIQNRAPEPGNVIHSDHGVQFNSWAFTRRAQESGLLPSMGSVGDCFDNAVIESFWGRMQVELLDRKRWRTRVELANAMFEYLEIFHNRQRRHIALGMHTPDRVRETPPRAPTRGMTPQRTDSEMSGEDQGVQQSGSTPRRATTHCNRIWQGPNLAASRSPQLTTSGPQPSPSRRRRTPCR